MDIAMQETEDTASNSEEVVSKEVKGKKRKSNPSQWKTNLRKQARLSGKEYTDYKALQAALTPGINCS